LPNNPDRAFGNPPLAGRSPLLLLINAVERSDGSGNPKSWIATLLPDSG
jgi:hypothetical protein